MTGGRRGGRGSFGYGEDGGRRLRGLGSTKILQQGLKCIRADNLLFCDGLNYDGNEFIVVSIIPKFF